MLKTTVLNHMRTSWRGARGCNLI